jgi:hypothetical protein
MSISNLRPGSAPTPTSARDRSAELFRQHLAGEPEAAPENWPFQALLAEARADLLQLDGLAIPEAPTAYAALLRELSREAVNILTGQSDFWQGHLEAVFLTGPAATGLAFPFYAQVEGVALPPETARLFTVIYSWLFTFLGKAPDLNGSRFLDSDISSGLNVHLFLTNPEKLPEGEVETRLREVFSEAGNFVPPFSCSVETVESLNAARVLSGYCIYGWVQAADTLRDAWESRGEAAMQAEGRTTVNALVRALQTQAVRASLGDQPLQRAGAGIVALYRRVRAEVLPTVCLDLLEKPESDGTGWRAENAAFFRLLKSGQYDRLVIEDAIRDLGDEKGAQKENAFTISRVLGLEVDGRLTPARDMVLKLRGLTAYRGDINNWLDLLKEYTSYAYIHNRLSGPSPYLLEIGPLLLTCEKLTVPFDREETRHWIGFFMEALHPPDQGRAFTSRVRFVTDFWSPRQSVEQVRRAAWRSRVKLDEASLVENLRELAIWSWSHGLSLTYCDLVLYLDEAQRVTGLRVIDLERLTYSELVDEEHLLLDVIVDIKAHLRKEPWYPVLTNLFRSRRDPQGFHSFSALRPYLYPKSRRRQLLLGVLRRLHDQSQRLGLRRGQAAWVRFLRMWARLSGITLWFGVR